MYARVPVSCGGTSLDADLLVPENAPGLVIFALGGGGERSARRNRAVAADLAASGLATFLPDPVSGREDLDPESRSDLEHLTRHLIDLTRWSARRPETAGLSVGYYGAGAGAAVALLAAARAPEVRTVVSRSGRLELAGDAVAAVHCPVLLIAGGADDALHEIHRDALARLAGDKALQGIPGATRYFEEPGALTAAAALASRWFRRHLGRPARAAGA